MTTILALVAINTLLFLGLSVSKVAPWPDPLHPRALSARARQVHDGSAGQAPRAASQTSVRQELLLGLVVVLHRLVRRGG